MNLHAVYRLFDNFIDAQYPVEKADWNYLMVIVDAINNTEDRFGYMHEVIISPGKCTIQSLGIRNGIVKAYCVNITSGDTRSAVIAACKIFIENQYTRV